MIWIRRSETLLNIMKNCFESSRRFSKHWMSGKGHPPPTSPHHSSTHTSTASSSTSASIRLPKIELPTFSGTYIEWTSSLDLFDANEHSKVWLTDAEKLNYLKSAVKGDAHRLIRNLPVTTANYSIARGILQDRFGNVRVIVCSHLEALFSYPALKSESASGLRKLL